MSLFPLLNFAYTRKERCKGSLIPLFYALLQEGPIDAVALSGYPYPVLFAPGLDMEHRLSRNEQHRVALAISIFALHEERAIQKFTFLFISCIILRKERRKHRSFPLHSLPFALSQDRVSTASEDGTIDKPRVVLSIRIFHSHRERATWKLARSFTSIVL